MSRNSDDYGPQILAFVAAFHAANRIPPTYREIAHGMGGWSVDRAFRHVRKLIQAGKLVHSGQFRGLMVNGGYVEPSPSAPPPPPAVVIPSGAWYRCTRCQIIIGTLTGMCGDCAGGSKYIQYADEMGAERFYQMSRPAPVGLGYEKETRPRVRRPYNRKVTS